MDWREEGLLLRRAPHGENSVIIEVFTREHGRHAGIVRGGTSRKMAAVLQPGTQVDVAWRARLEDHLGTYTVELVQSRAHLTQDRLTLSGLNALTGILSYALPEREAHSALYRQTLAVLELMEEAFWPLAYLRWELSLLDELGFGLDLERCVVTGSDQNLVYVSPKSGRAVAASAAGEWADRLLPLSPALVGKSAEYEDILNGLKVTGHFLRNHLAPALGSKPFPEGRQRLIDRLYKA
ncbi:MAG: DNA repair protein RecO [Pseudomonadota bacterium]